MNWAWLSSPFLLIGFFLDLNFTELSLALPVTYLTWLWQQWDLTLFLKSTQNGSKIKTAEYFRFCSINLLKVLQGYIADVQTQKIRLSLDNITSKLPPKTLPKIVPILQKFNLKVHFCPPRSISVLIFTFKSPKSEIGRLILFAIGLRLVWWLRLSDISVKQLRLVSDNLTFLCKT